jgi:transcriptional regulator with XRE-family HTH domain
MCQLTDLQIEKILEILKESEITSYKISKDTGITQSTLGNYRNGKTIPTQANALILKRYFGIDFAEKTGNFSDNTNSVVLGDNNSTGNIDNRHYYSDSPDVLRAQIDLLDERIKEKDAQIKEKDAQIARLLGVIEKMSAKG